jgi:hypothetical protein
MISDGNKNSTTFVPSSNISTFLLSKGSSDSLGTFDNEYSYRINLESFGGGGGGMPASSQSMFQNQMQQAHIL